MMMTTNRLDVA